MTPTVIAIFMVVMIVGLSAFDLYLSHGDKIEGNTFSARFRAMGRWWPPARLVMMLAIGAVLGHLFWTSQDVHDAGGDKLCACPIDAGVPTETGPADAADVAPASTH
jgi:hypothetical protein